MSFSINRSYVAVAVAGALTLVVSCSSPNTGFGGDGGVDGSRSGSGGNGGSAAGGSSAGGYAAGGSGTGGYGAAGSGSGGYAAGGSGTGGYATGGSSAGGYATGGSSVGGTASGGSSTGGSAAGGTSTGGTAAGGSAVGGSSAGGAGGTSGVDSGPPCTATIASGAIPLVSHYQTAVGDGGYAFAYQDTGGSTACVDAAAACLKGSTDIAGTTTVTFSTNWGAGLGFSLNQTQGSGTVASGTPEAYTIPSTAKGISYSLSNLPTQGMRIILGNANPAGTSGQDYCAILTAKSGTIPWASFSTTCYNSTGTYLSAPPVGPTHIEFEVVADTTVTPFDFCVTELSFSNTATGGGGSGGSGSGGSGGSGQACTWSGLSGANGDGEFTCYWFSQGTATGGGCSSYKTFCGYCGTQSGSGSGVCDNGLTESVTNISTGTSTSAGNYFAAFPSQSFGSGSYCGMCVDVSYQGRSAIATIVDECATCGDSAEHIDLSTELAAYLGLGVGGSTGNPSGVTWTPVSCPVSGDIVAVFNGGSAQVYLQNVRYPVASVSGATQSNGFWNFGSNAAGRTVTITDKAGDAVVGTCVIPTSSGASLGCQFAAPATCNAP